MKCKIRRNLHLLSSAVRVRVVPLQEQREEEQINALLSLIGRFIFYFRTNPSGIIEIY